MRWLEGRLLSGKPLERQDAIEKLFAMGGPSSMPGFPRSSDLFFNQRKVITLGARLEPILTHWDLNLLRMAWLHRADPYLSYHYGQGKKETELEPEVFHDLEFL